jgi:hypothetical protein
LHLEGRLFLLRYQTSAANTSTPAPGYNVRGKSGRLPMRRKLTILVLCLILAASGAAVWLLWPQPSDITKENIARIKKDMTRDEVELILGGPARDESAGRLIAYTDVVRKGDSRRWLSFGDGPDCWTGPRWAIKIEFEDGLVSEWATGSVTLEGETWNLRIRRWLRI